MIRFLVFSYPDGISPNFFFLIFLVKYIFLQDNKKIEYFEITSIGRGIHLIKMIEILKIHMFVS